MPEMERDEQLFKEQLFKICSFCSLKFITIPFDDNIVFLVFSNPINTTESTQPGKKYSELVSDINFS